MSIHTTPGWQVLRCNEPGRLCVFIHVVGIQPLVATDEATFVLLVQPLMEPGLRVAWAMLGDRSDAEDATQEAVTRAWRKLYQLRPGMPVRPWFLAIVANQCRCVRRRRWLRLNRGGTGVVEAAATPEPGDRLDLERALARLRVRDREVLFLRYYLDLPMAEIGVALGISPGNARVRVHRAIARLRPGLIDMEARP